MIWGPVVWDSRDAPNKTVLFKGILGIHTTNLPSVEESGRQNNN